MRRSIFWRFTVAYIIFVFFGFCTINYTTTRHIYDHLIKTEAKSMYSHATTISENISLDISSDLNNFPSSGWIMDACVDGTVWITDIEGAILYSTDKDNSPTIISSFSLDYFNDTYYSIGNFFDNYKKSVLSVYKPIIIGDRIEGYVFIHLPTSEILLNTIKIVDIFYITYFIILLFSMLLLLAFIVYIYMPLREVRKATIEYANGNFAYDKLKYRSNDEIGDVASSLTYMAHQLNDAEEYQKKFVANISHDFRSPLTSIKGYVEAIMDGTIPYENQNKYLNIVLTEAERLERLTSGLITLNTWGSKKPGLILEDFNIDTVITSIIESFEGTCNKKNICISYNHGIETSVRADKDKIQQVLYNLIDNAIKFSHQNSQIKIKVYGKGDKIFCSIKDTGIGIPKDELNKIWDRFYKSDSSRGKDRIGSGIGLAIVKEIINAHNQTIDVISTEEVGTEFIFSLKKSK